MYNDEDLPSPPGRLFPLPESLAQFVRKLGIHNALRDTEHQVAELEVLLSYIAETDCDKTPGFLSNDYNTEIFAAIPRYSAARDYAQEYPARAILSLRHLLPVETFKADDYYALGSCLWSNSCCLPRRSSLSLA